MPFTTDERDRRTFADAVNDTRMSLYRRFQNTLADASVEVGDLCLFNTEGDALELGVYLGDTGSLHLILFPDGLLATVGYVAMFHSVVVRARDAGG